MPSLKHSLLGLAVFAAGALGAAAQDLTQEYEDPFAAELQANAAIEQPVAIEQQALPNAAMWDGADLAVIAPLLAATITDNLPQTAKEILANLLRASNQPEGAGEDYRAMRLATLGHLGDLAAISTLTQNGLEGTNAAAMAEGNISATLLSDGLSAACNAQTNLPSTLKQGAHWARLEAVCFARQDQSIQADLALEIVAEANTPDPLFDKLYTALTTQSTEVELPAADLSAGNAFSRALHMAIARDIGLDPALLGATPDQTLSRLTLMRAEGAPLNTRILAAEKAMMAGQITKNELATLYTAGYAEVSGEGETTLPEPMQQAALHYNVVQNPQLGLESAPAIAAAFNEAAQRSTLPAVAMLYTDALATQEAEFASEEDAAIIARGLLSIGDFAAAKPWFMISYQAARDNSPGAFERMNSAWPLIGMAEAASVPRGIEKLAAGWLTTLALEDDAARRKAVLLFTLLEGFGRPVEENLWAQLLPGEEAKPYHLVDHTLWRGMEAAAARGERGMALTLLLNGLSQAPIADHHPAYLASAVNVLIKIDREAEGHKLAVDALLAAGF